MNMKRLFTGDGIFFLIMAFAVLGFEGFNYSSTQESLKDLLYNTSFAGIPWYTLLAFSFCAIDLGGLARMFTPQQGRDEPAFVWYLFGAWVICAGINAGFTWFGLKVIISASPSLPAASVIDRDFITNILPVAMAIFIWLIRLLLVGTMSTAGDRLFHGPNPASRSGNYQNPQFNPQHRPGTVPTQTYPAKPVTTTYNNPNQQRRQ